MLKLDEVTIKYVQDKVMQSGENGIFSKDLYDQYGDIDQKVIIAKAINHLTRSGFIYYNSVDKKYRYNIDAITINVENRIIEEKEDIRTEPVTHRVVKGDYGNLKRITTSRKEITPRQPSSI